MTKFLARCLDTLFLARPVILIPVWGFSIFGYWCGHRVENTFAFSFLSSSNHFPAFGPMVLFSFSVGAVYVFNQIADLKVDAENEGFPLLVRSGISRRTALWYALLLCSIAVITPLFTGDIPLSLFSLGTILLGIIYSFKPVYFSGRPVTDFLSNAFGYTVIAFGVGWYLSPQTEILSMHFLRAVAPYFLLMCGGSISSTLPDIPGDEACGKRTTAVMMGKIPAHCLTIVFIFAGGITALVTADVIAIIIALEFFIIDLLYLLKKTDILMEATYKVTGGIAMTLAGVVYPLFIPVAVAVFAATWLYFRLRHGVSYPSLVPVSHASTKN